MSKRAGAVLRLLNLGAGGAFTVPKDLARLRAALIVSLR